MTDIAEIAPDVFRLTLYVAEFDLQFSHFLVRDEEPLLFHTGMRMHHQPLREAVGKLIDVADLRWISFSHFEVDECGALNEWLAAAPNATPMCGIVGAMVNLADFANRPPRGLHPSELVETGRHRFRFVPTPHLPHGWDAGVLFDETDGTLFCSDLFHQGGQREPLTEDDLLDRCRAAMQGMQASPLMDYMPYTPKTDGLLEKLAQLEPKTLAVMHGSSFTGDCASALRGLAPVMREEMG